MNDSHWSMDQNNRVGRACASVSLWIQQHDAAQISSVVSSPCKGEEDLCWCWWCSCCFLQVKQKVEKNHICMVSWTSYKIFLVPKIMRKLSSPRNSVTSRYPCPALHALYSAQIGSTKTFSAPKSCASGRTTEKCTVTQRREGWSPTGFLTGTAIVQSASGLRSLTDGCSETRTVYRWWIHSLWDQWWAGWQPNMVADSKSLYYPHTPCYHDIFHFGKGKGI